MLVYLQFEVNNLQSRIFQFLNRLESNALQQGHHNNLALFVVQGLQAEIAVEQGTEQEFCDESLFRMANYHILFRRMNTRTHLKTKKKTTQQCYRGQLKVNQTIPNPDNSQTLD